MKLNKSPLLTLLIAILACSVLAQPLPPGESRSRKATKLFKESIAHYQLNEFDQALTLVNKALEADPKYIDALLLAAELNSMKRQSALAISQYEKVVSLRPDFYLGWYFMGEELFQAAHYERAIKAYKTYLDARENNPARINKVRVRLKSCEFAVNSMKNPVPFEPVNLGPSINTLKDECTPALTIDGNTLIYTRLLIPGDSINMGNIGSFPDNVRMQLYQGMHEDFFISQKVNGKWGPARNIGSPINTQENEGQPFFSADGNVLFFTKCSGRNCDIYYTYLDGDKWARPVSLRDSVNSRYWESQPSISFDGKTLYFSSDREGGFGEQDIYESTYLGGKWSKPKNLGARINTPGKEQNPCIAKDNNTLYFNSDGHASMGGIDLYVSYRQTNGEWGEPINLGYPINTPGDELTLSVTGEGDYAYYVSDKLKDGKGGFDIYYFKLPENIRPLRTNYLQAIVFDAENPEKKLMAKVELIDLETGKPVIESYSNKKSGEFMVSLPLNRNYALNVSTDGYLFYSENFSLKEKPGSEPYHMNVGLKPIKVGQSVVLRNVFFNTDKFDLKPESKVELNKLVAFLNANPNIRIELGGHTDNQGDQKKNIPLSQNRAKAVMDYLIAHGIAKERLTAKGYADTRPIDDNYSEAGRAQNRRTEFIIIP